MADPTKPKFALEYALNYIGGGERESDEVLVSDVSLFDALNDCFKIELHCRIVSAKNETPRQICDARRSKNVEILLRRRYDDDDLVTRIAGLILSIDRQTPLGGEDTYVITVVPALALLAHEVKGGTWHCRTYPEVLNEVLSAGLGRYGRGLDNRLSRDYPVVDCITRYPDENTLAFVRRIAAVAGISFYFDHDAGLERVVLCDTNEGFMDGRQRMPAGVPFETLWPTGDGHADVDEHIRSIRNGASLGPSSIVYRSFDVAKTPEQPVEATSKLEGGDGATSFVSDAYRVNEKVDPDVQAAAKAQLRGELEKARTSVLHVTSTISGSLAGRRYLIAVDSKPRQYVIIRVEARGRSLRVGSDYENLLTLVPTQDDAGQNIQVRALTPVEEKHASGVMRAEIVAIDNDPVDVEGLLRCRLRFAWDQNASEIPTTYVSVLQPMAGRHGGTQYIPRAGDRVLVSFLGGNLERPVILGCLYDNQHKPPPMGPPERSQTLPAAAPWLGFNYASIGDTSRQSMFTMDVTAGNELMYFNAPFDWRQDVGNNQAVNVRANETRNVGGEFNEHVGGNYFQVVEGNREEWVYGHYTLNVGGGGGKSGGGGGGGGGAAGTTFVHMKGHAAKAIVDTPFDIEYLQDVKTAHRTSYISRFDVGRTETVKQGNIATEIESGDMLTKVRDGVITYAVGGLFSVVAKECFVHITGQGENGLKLGEMAMLKSDKSTSLQAGASKVEVTPESATVSGTAVTLADQGGGKATLKDGSCVVEAPQGIVFRCGESELRLTPQGVFVNGQQLVFNASTTKVVTSSFDVVEPEET